MTPETQLTTEPRRGHRARSALAIALLVLTALSVTTAARRADAADDIDLLRENGGNPFVMILLDTSASMALLPPESSDGDRYLGDLATANGDDPQSKLFQVKQALYEVFSRVENVSFGFAEYNKDHVRVLRKHWLYAPATSVDHLVLTYPVAAPDGATNRQQLESYWVFGDPVIGTEAGSCSSPIEVGTQDKANGKIRLNRFPKNVGGGNVVRHWIELTNVTYALDVEATTGSIGDPTMEIQVTLSPVASCSPLQLDAAISEQVVTFGRVTDFLMVEADTATGAKTGGNADPGVESAPAAIANDSFLSSNCNENENLAGFWNLQDIAADGTCGADQTRPFTGRGAEMNTDSGAREGHPDLDRYCGPDDDWPTCFNLRFPTALHPQFPELDSGDFIPMDWEADHREEFLKRLNPRHPDAPPENEIDPDILRQYFGIAPFFEDDPDASSGLLGLRNEDEKPIMAFGNSPLARAVNDFRCWYNRGESSGGTNKCKAENFDDGFEKLFLENDSAFKCRIPYLITITDGEENSLDENFAADFNDLDGKHGIRNWIFSFQDHPDYQRVVSNAAAEVILVSNREDLKTKLEEVIGTITQATRTFATAAVPSVEAAVESRIFLTKFQPLNDAGVWEGHLHAFSLPMPTDRTDVPNQNYPNHLWDAGRRILAQAPDRPADGDLSGFTDDADLQLGPGAAQRRVLWAEDKVPDSQGRPPTPANANMFTVSAGPEEPDPDVPPSTTTTAEERAFWEALDLPYDAADGNSVARTRGRANDVVRETLVEKESPLVSDTDDLDFYVLGDIFHSNPLVVGGPLNTRYFVEDAEESFDDSGVAQGTGYREFFNRHENRRKLLIAGANDGMLHAFEAGVGGIQTENDIPQVEFTRGSGREVFSFVPDGTMAMVKLAAENAETHRWGVDGSPAAGDVFIDPLHNGVPSVSEREWRTVVVTGLREGGSGYFALDVTHPDPLTEVTVGPSSEPVASRTVSLIASGARPTGDENDPISDQDTPNSLIVPGCHAGPDTPGCGQTLPYPAVLWEFRDRVWDSTAAEPGWVALDEDGNGFADLGETWSTPDIGRIKVVEGGELVNKYVAVFGGGHDPAKADSRGDWIYMVDTETGQAIYKRQLVGSAPSDPAAVDTDQDGFLDRIYIGTTAGKLYRVDLVEVDAAGNVTFPVLEAQAKDGVRGINGVNYKTTAPPRIERGNGAEPRWEPRLIFDTTAVVDGETVARPIYYQPSVLFVANLGEFALAFGTGDRDDLTSRDGTTGRFYVFVDETHRLSDADLPMVEGDLERIDPGEPDNDDLLTDPTLPVGEKGWFLVLSDKERLIGDPFGFSGVTFFATFEADVNASCSVTCPSDLPDGETCTECRKPKQGEALGPETSPQCTIGGLSRIYLVGTTDADALGTFGGVLSRAFEIPGQFVTSPFTEQASLPSDRAGSSDTDTGPEFSEDELKTMEKLKELFPERCKFGNHRTDIKVIRADSQLERVASVPTCIVEKNWKELAE